MARGVSSSWVGGLALVALVGCASSATGPAAEAEGSEATEARFAQLVGRMERGEEVDFLELRRAFVGTGGYRPYGADAVDEPEREMAAAMREKNFTLARERAERILEVSPIYPDAYWVLYVAARELGEEERADALRPTLRGLHASICGENDGRDPERPCWVLATYEEYFYLRLLGLKVREQSLVQCAGRPCDAMEVVDSESGERFTVYFDVSTPFGYLGGQLRE